MTMKIKVFCYVKNCSVLPRFQFSKENYDSVFSMCFSLGNASTNFTLNVEANYQIT